MFKLRPLRDYIYIYHNLCNIPQINRSNTDCDTKVGQEVEHLGEHLQRKRKKATLEWQNQPIEKSSTIKETITVSATYKTFAMQPIQTLSLTPYK